MLLIFPSVSAPTEDERILEPGGKREREKGGTSRVFPIVGMASYFTERLQGRFEESFIFPLLPRLIQSASLTCVFPKEEYKKPANNGYFRRYTPKPKHFLSLEPGSFSTLLRSTPTSVVLKQRKATSSAIGFLDTTGKPETTREEEVFHPLERRVVLRPFRVVRPTFVASCTFHHAAIGILP